MTEYACLMFPFPPSANGIRRSDRGFVHKSASCKRFEEDAARHLKHQEPLPRFDGPVRIVAALGPPDKRARDIDNHWKLVGDALQDQKKGKVVIERRILPNDNLIQDLRLYWDSETQGCRVEIFAI